MTTSSWNRARRVAAAASVLTVLAVVAGAVILALGVGVPDGWWPHTGQAFATSTRTAHHDPCALIVGPAKAYCERGATTTASLLLSGTGVTAATASLLFCELVRCRRSFIRLR